MENNTTNNQVANYTFLDTVESNKSYFQRRKIKGAGAGRILKQLVGWSPTQALK